MIQKITGRIFFLMVLLVSFSGFSAETHQNGNKEDLNLKEFIVHHITDSHDYHLLDWNGHPISIPLPVILWTKNGLVSFSSGKFHHDDNGEVVVQRNGMEFVKYHGKIYYNDRNTEGKFEERPIDFSITKNVVVLFMVSFLMFLIFIPVARSYKKNKKAPKGLAAFIEPLVLFVRDDISVPNIGKHKSEKYLPYLLTVFFLIWFGNILGLIPFVSGTLTNYILFTATMAICTFLVVIFSGNKNYWKHIFATPGVPKWLLPIMIPVELLGIFTKPFALMVRLFANITAGHIVLMSLISLVFVFKSIYTSPASILLGVFINLIEIMVAFIQAYVFTLLSALFIGQAVEEEHH